MEQLRLDFSPENDSQEVIAKLLANVRVRIPAM
jgi:hypothetical protein